MRPSRQPAHTRTLTVRLTPGAERRLTADARLIDVRKRGVVRVGSRLNGPGVIHDLRIELVLSPGAERIVDARLSMASVPFAASARAEGEGCRDNERRASALIGLPLGNGFLSGLQRVMGGVRGCFHVFTLMRMVATTTARACRQGLRHDVFSRALTVDASWSADGLVLDGSLTDLAAELRASDERPVAQFEAAAHLAASPHDLRITRAEAAYRSAGDLDVGGWTATGLDALLGQSLARGYAMKLPDVVPSRGAEAPLHDVLRMMQPVAFQAMPAMPGVDPTAAPRPHRPAVARDSCIMWRQDGPLVRAIEEEARGGVD